MSRGIVVRECQKVLLQMSWGFVILYNMQTIFGFVNIFAYEGPSLLAKETLFIVKLTDWIFERNAKRREITLAIRKKTDLMRKDFYMKTLWNYLDRKG